MVRSRDVRSVRAAVVGVGLSVGLVASWLALAVAAPAALADDVPVIIGFHGKANSKVLEKHGGRVRGDLGAFRAIAGSVPAKKLRALRSEAGVAYVEEDLVATRTWAPNDPHFSGGGQGQLWQIGCPAAWDVSLGGTTVAILDTGCDKNHQDIYGAVSTWENFTNSWINTWRWLGYRDYDVTDVNGHGTWCAGMVGAWTGNGIGIASVAPACWLAIGKVLGNNGSGYYSWMCLGLDWASGQAGAKVISMSLGGTGASSSLLNAVNTATSRGALVVAAAGNSNTNAAFYPAYYANCVAVAATDGADQRAWFSNYGWWVDIAAPGVGLVSTTPGNGYSWYSGTSMATPHVAGIAALVWTSPHGTSLASVRGRILYTGGVVVATPDGSFLKRLSAAAAVGVPGY